MVTIYRGTNTPVFIGSTFVKRAQSFNVIMTNNEEVVSELNNSVPVGIISRALDYTASMTINEVGQGILGALGITSFAEYGVSPTEVTIASLAYGITGAIVSSIILESDVKSPATMNAEFIGKGVTTNLTATPAVDLTLPGAIMYPLCNASVGTHIQKVTLSARNEVKLIYEFGTTTPVGWTLGKQSVRLEIECLHPGACPQYLLESAAQDIVVTISGLSLTVKRCITTGEPKAGSVRGWITNRYMYESLDSNFIVS
jgi:hypothetical protein